MNQRSVLKRELNGIWVIFLLGALFHFLYELTGSHPPVGAFAPVNESIFEHLKMTFWPTILWSIFSYRFLKTNARNFLVSRGAALFTMPIVILLLFYSYTALTGAENVIVDIVIFLIAIAAGQMAGYWLLIRKPLPIWLAAISVILIITLGFTYIFFTFYPPYTSLFLDTNTNSYGIPSM
jgi:hypothetical protein